MDDLQPSENEDKSPHSNPDTAGTLVLPVPETERMWVETQRCGRGRALGTLGLISSMNTFTTQRLLSGFKYYQLPSVGNALPGFLMILLR